MRPINRNRSFSSYFFLMSFVLLNSGCFTHYYKYDKKTCSEVNDKSSEHIMNIIKSTGYNETNIILNDTTFQYTKRKTVAYSDILKVVVQTKKMLKGKRYMLVIVMNNRDKHVFETYDFDMAINAYSALECKAGIKPKSQSNATTDKYLKIEKLKALYDSGALTLEEFEREKKKVLDEK